MTGKPEVVRLFPCARRIASLHVSAVGDLRKAGTVENSALPIEKPVSQLVVFSLNGARAGRTRLMSLIQRRRGCESGLMILDNYFV
jgi:hypothetical protein